MMVVYMLGGIVTGITAAATGQFVGFPLWTILPLYVGGGLLAVLALAGVAYVLSQASGAFHAETAAADESFSELPESVLAQA